MKRIRLALTALALTMTMALGFVNPTYANRIVNTVTGTVQDTSFADLTITVGGQVFHVAKNAVYKGVGGFASLNRGMRLQLVLSDPSADGTVVVTQVIVLTSGD